MSESDDRSEDGVESIEDALSRINISIKSYNKSDLNIEHSSPLKQGNGNLEPEALHTICSDYARGIEWATGEPLFSTTADAESCDHFPEITNLEFRKRLNILHELRGSLPAQPYSIDLYSRIASAYSAAGYPDLAAGAAYKALLLIDQLDDEDAEFYEPTFLSLAESISKATLPSRCEVLRKHADLQKSLFHPDLVQRDEDGRAMFPVLEDEVHVWAREELSQRVYTVLAQCLHICGCERSSAEYCYKGLELFPDNDALKETLKAIYTSVSGDSSLYEGNGSMPKPSIDQLPDQGMVRRECYPWNTFEPDRCSDESVSFLNAEMSKVAPKLEVKATDLPALAGQGGISRQLGVFAKEDIAPGEIVLKETSLLTANIHLQDALCDACSADLPEMNDPAFSEVVACPECSVVFCNQTCADLADEEYHPAICDKGVEDVAKNVPPTEAANTLYTLLLLRALAMAETQECHPLDLKYLKFIWGDYHTMDLSETWKQDEDRFPHTLPFSFQANVVLPFNILEMMDVDVFQSSQYDVWVFNTLYAKFRGTASARLSGLSGRPVRGPEVSAVHPNWCLANHSCDPNVTWNWSSEVKFRVLEERAEWKLPGNNTRQRSLPGLKKGEEVLSHYCDIGLPVKERREWAAGSLGGACACARCVAEAGEDA